MRVCPPLPVFSAARVEPGLRGPLLMLRVLAHTVFAAAALPSEALLLLAAPDDPMLELLDGVCAQVDVPCGAVDCGLEAAFCGGIPGAGASQYVILQSGHFQPVPREKAAAKYAAMWFQDMFCTDLCHELRAQLRLHTVFSVRGPASVRADFQAQLNRFKLAAVFVFAEDAAFALSANLDGRDFAYEGPCDMGHVARFLASRTNSALPRADGRGLSALLAGGEATVLLLPDFGAHAAALDAVYARGYERVLYADCSRVPDYCNRFNALQGGAAVLIRGAAQQYAVLRGEVGAVLAQLASGEFAMLSEAELVQQLSSE
ncbi:hypothetical protein SS50377_24048 [Spironucleus salmonicida]|uniref:Uncharacterized protein n=1 Tax=Spironucleus salmonicida TaxID=348837 RepID=A0A9P8LTP9_9EUKA|nr:hypothetical protein SS50377_24048 [Spironucleus salmonicida]